MSGREIDRLLDTDTEPFWDGVLDAYRRLPADPNEWRDYVAETEPFRAASLEVARAVPD
jgi:hypothetical protein